VDAGRGRGMLLNISSAGEHFNVRAGRMVVIVVDIRRIEYICAMFPSTRLMTSSVVVDEVGSGTEGAHSEDDGEADQANDDEAGVEGGANNSVANTRSPAAGGATVQEALASPAKISVAAAAGHVGAAMVALYTSVTRGAQLGVKGGPKVERRGLDGGSGGGRALLQAVVPTTTATTTIISSFSFYMPFLVLFVLVLVLATLVADRGAAVGAEDGRGVRGGHGEDFAPAAIARAPSDVRVGGVGVAGAEVAQLGHGARRHDGGDVVVDGGDLAAAGHAGEAGVAAREDGAAPVGVEAEAAVDVLAARAAAELRHADVAVADLAELFRCPGGRLHGRRLRLRGSPAATVGGRAVRAY
jgi:hypothetical protein